MARNFFFIAVLAVFLLAANLIVGLTIGDYGAAARDLVHADRELVKRSTNPSSPAASVREAQDRLAEVSRSFAPISRRKTLHMWIGIASALVTLLVNAIAVTYFIGTSRWCREVVDAYGLDWKLADESDRLKRRTFPWALAGMFAILIVVSLGALADPGANFAGSAAWVLPHWMAAVAGTAVIAWSFLVQVGNIGANYDVIERIQIQVHDVREATRAGAKPAVPEHRTPPAGV